MKLMMLTRSADGIWSQGTDRHQVSAQLHPMMDATQRKIKDIGALNALSVQLQNTP